MEMNAVDIDLSFADEDPQEVLALLEELGGTDVKNVAQRGLTGVEIIVVGTLAASALINLIMRLLRLWQCGVILDARESPVTTQKNCDLPRGSVTIISGNGTQVTLDKPSETEIADLIKAAVPMKG
jgi:hypothetical protein